MRALRNTLMIVCLSAPLGFGAGACTGEIGDDGLGEVSAEPTRQQIDVARLAIFDGLDVGTTSIVSSVNRVLSENLLDDQFAEGSVLQAPTPPAPESCPFIEAPAADVSLDCRFIVERARDLAYAAMGPELDDGPSNPALAAETDQQWVHFWFQQGAFSGVDGEVVRAVAELRRLGACDTAPTPVQNSEMAGYELGRAIFLERLAAQLAITPATVCDFDNGIIDPARDAAEAIIGRSIEEQPLCGGFAPTDATVVLELDRAKLAYELGVRAGIRDQATLSSQDLLSTWVCTPPVPEGGGGGGGGGAGDPLIVDVLGDGVAPLTLDAGVRFDLTGTGLVDRVAWPQGDDALLAIDLDGSGAIESGRELFSNYMVGVGGARFGTGFEALAVYDRAVMGGNGDGAISAEDDVFGELLVWTDRDGDGVSQADELSSLAAVGVESLALTPTELGRVRHGDGVMTERAGALTEVWLDLRY